MSSAAAPVSNLPTPALQASQAALQAALADSQSKESKKPAPISTAADGERKAGDADALEPGEIQEVDMQAQAENIRTVFNDPTNFNVKVYMFLTFFSLSLFPSLLFVRFFFLSFFRFHLPI